MSMPDRLYGVPGAEELRLDPAGVYESDVEPWVEEGAEPARREIEEWSVLPAIDHVPNAVTIMDWLVEWIGETGEIDEVAYESWRAFSLHADVLAAVEGLRSVLASKITYSMADKHLRSLWVTWADDGSPLLDGVPMYHKIEGAEPTRGSGLARGESDGARVAIPPAADSTGASAPSYHRPEGTE